MADLIFYTNPQSRGQTVRWMLEEVGAALRDRDSRLRIDHEGGAVSVDQSDGEGPGDQAQGQGRHRSRSDLLLSRRCLPGSGPRPARGDRADYYRWIFFTSGPVEAAFSNKAAGWEPTPERQRMFGYGNYDLAINTLEKALAGKRIYRRRPFHRGRPVRRRQRQLHAGVQPARAASGVRRLCAAHDRP